MGKFWRSLNLKLIVFVYLLLLQALICGAYYFQVMNSDQFYEIVLEVADGGNYPETPSRYIFFKLPITAWLICLDILRPILLILFYLRIKTPYFYFVACALFLLYRNDLDMPYVDIDTGVFSHTAYLMKTEPEWKVNLLKNPLAQFSVLNEMLIRLWVAALVIERWKLPAMKPQNIWSFSLTDLLVFASLLGATIAILR